MNVEIFNEFWEILRCVILINFFWGGECVEFGRDILYVNRYCEFLRKKYNM